MTGTDATRVWTLNYRLLTSVISSVTGDVQALGLETKDLFLLSELDAHPHPAELAVTLLMPKPSVTVAVKRLEAGGFLRREIDTTDLRKHRLTMTPAGRKAMTRGLGLMAKAFGVRLGRLTAAQQEELKGLLEKLS